MFFSMQESSWDKAKYWLQQDSIAFVLIVDRSNWTVYVVF